MARPTLRDYHMFGGLTAMDATLRPVQAVPGRLPSRDDWLQTLDNFPDVAPEDIPAQHRICVICLEHLANTDESPPEEGLELLAELPFAEPKMGGRPVSLTCETKHSFHVNCIKEHFRSQTSCPLCRKDYLYERKLGTLEARREAFEQLNLQEIGVLPIDAYHEDSGWIGSFCGMITMHLWHFMYLFAELQGRSDLMYNDDMPVVDLCKTIHLVLFKHGNQLGCKYTQAYALIAAIVDDYVVELADQPRWKIPAWAQDIRRLQIIILDAAWMGLKVCLLKQTFIPLLEIREFEIMMGNPWPEGWVHNETIGSSTVIFASPLIPLSEKPPSTNARVMIRKWENQGSRPVQLERLEINIPHNNQPNHLSSKHLPNRIQESHHKVGFPTMVPTIPLRERYTYSGLYKYRRDAVPSEPSDLKRLPTQEAWQETLDELPAIVNIDEIPDEDRTCMVCLEDLKTAAVEVQAEATIFAELPFADNTNMEGGYPVTLPCSHKFHIGCIKAHFVSKGCCPLCRKEFWEVEARNGTIQARREAFERMNLRQIRAITIPDDAPMRCFRALIVHEISNMVQVMAEVHGRVNLVTYPDEYDRISDIMHVINNHLYDYRYSLGRPMGEVARGLCKVVQKYVNRGLTPFMRVKTEWAPWRKDIRHVERIVLQAVWLGVKISLLKQTFIPYLKIKEYQLERGCGWPSHFDRGGPFGSETVLFDDEYLLEPEDDEDLMDIDDEVEDDEGEIEDRYTWMGRYEVLYQQYRGLLDRQNMNPGSLSQYEEAAFERLRNELRRLLTALGMEQDGDLPTTEVLLERDDEEQRAEYRRLRQEWHALLEQAAANPGQYRQELQAYALRVIETIRSRAAQAGIHLDEVHFPDENHEDENHEDETLEDKTDVEDEMDTDDETDLEDEMDLED
ncbi:hypothetical protein BU16DRAFT_598068 [Lophium mytilinum]|uniref:RING-type domain-containing protein n=1 Tax=Lophium mytilinum TaxID=390894 RepID=A0A6A6QB50_9PEZI|nr:hypothetical protein BU16DRAFT_598068 [Lophium mytilinum]